MPVTMPLEAFALQFVFPWYGFVFSEKREEEKKTHTQIADRTRKMKLLKYILLSKGSRFIQHIHKLIIPKALDTRQNDFNKTEKMGK